jgi:hypothetical protein
MRFADITGGLRRLQKESELYKEGVPHGSFPAMGQQLSSGSADAPMKLQPSGGSQLPTNDRNRSSFADNPSQSTGLFSGGLKGGQMPASRRQSQPQPHYSSSKSSAGSALAAERSPGMTSFEGGYDKSNLQDGGEGASKEVQQYSLYQSAGLQGFFCFCHLQLPAIDRRSDATHGGQDPIAGGVLGHSSAGGTESRPHGLKGVQLPASKSTQPGRQEAGHTGLSAKQPASLGGKTTFEGGYDKSDLQDTGRPAEKQGSSAEVTGSEGQRLEASRKRESERLSGVQVREYCVRILLSTFWRDVLTDRPQRSAVPANALVKSQRALV